jgi:hypothetical protein
VTSAISGSCVVSVGASSGAAHRAGRPSQVKGAFGVATRWRTRHPGAGGFKWRVHTGLTWDPREGSRRPNSGQARGLPSTTRDTPSYHDRADNHDRQERLDSAS